MSCGCRRARSRARGRLTGHEAAAAPALSGRQRAGGGHESHPIELCFRLRALHAPASDRDRQAALGRLPRGLFPAAPHDGRRALELGEAGSVSSERGGARRGPPRLGLARGGGGGRERAPPNPPSLHPLPGGAPRSYPLIAVVVLASSVGLYSGFRHLWTNPEARGLLGGSTCRRQRRRSRRR